MGGARRNLFRGRVGLGVDAAHGAEVTHTAEMRAYRSAKRGAVAVGRLRAVATCGAMGPKPLGSWTLVALGAALCAGGCGGRPTPASSPVPSAKTYAIVFDRGTTAGARARLTVAAERKVGQRTFQGKRLVKSTEERMRLAFDAEVRVIETGGAGSGAKLELTVARFVVARADGVPHEQIREGRRLLLARAAVKDDATLTIDGEPADAATREAFDDVIRLREPEHDSDAALGTSTPQPVGASWAIDAEQARRDILVGAGLDGEIAGSCRLEDASESAAGPTLKIACSLRGRVTEWRGPTGMRLRRGTLTAEARAVTPPGTTSGESDVAVHAELWVDGARNGQPFTIEVVHDEHTHKLWQPL